PLGLGPRRCSSRATNSFPVPLSPTMSTELGTGATRTIASLSFASAGLVPTSGDSSEAASQERDLGRQAAALHRILHLLRDPFHRLGLVDEAVGAKPDRLRAAVVIARSRVHDDRHTQSQALDRAQYLEAIHAGHLEIEND